MPEPSDNPRDLGAEAPRPGIWICPNCACRIQIIVDPNQEWTQPFTCVCGYEMEPGEEHESSMTTASECAHCRVSITDTSTAVDVDNRRFCCPNCAAADAERPVTASSRRAGTM